ncbi:hypothetical protein J5N97_029590 [Dioscorea zingiberensis]|uniref:Pectinesterase inhibitor domain-containing protein n=1 Tax=Dioscorea zingiberensis TaxID=325984 RepID=A0A9D5BVP3_9LILI|nr:hypothetical protein J5N97_029590 [Dioscorea zingiberensis]
MNLLYSICILFSTFILRQPLAHAFASVEATCKAAAERNRAVNYDFCVIHFLRHPRSGDVDERGLASIAASMSINTAYNVQYTIQSLLKKPHDSATISGLHNCKVLYTRMLTTLAEAVDTINGRQDGMAKNCLEMAIKEARSCEEGFMFGQNKEIGRKRGPEIEEQAEQNAADQEPHKDC